MGRGGGGLETPHFQTVAILSIIIVATSGYALVMCLFIAHRTTLHLQKMWDLTSTLCYW